MPRTPHDLSDSHAACLRLERAYRLALLKLVMKLLGLLLRVAPLLDLHSQLLPLGPEGLLQQLTSSWAEGQACVGW